MGGQSGCYCIDADGHGFFRYRLGCGRDNGQFVRIHAQVIGKGNHDRHGARVVNAGTQMQYRGKRAAQVVCLAYGSKNSIQSDYRTTCRYWPGP